MDGTVAYAERVKFMNLTPIVEKCSVWTFLDGKRKCRTASLKWMVERGPEYGGFYLAP